jgi:cold shock CspA family protein
MSDEKPRLYGTIVSCRFNTEMTRGYGFICPEASDGSRESHVWVGCHSAQDAAPVRIGDRVSYILKRDRMGGKDVAANVRQAPLRSEVA